MNEQEHHFALLEYFCASTKSRGVGALCLCPQAKCICTLTAWGCHCTYQISGMPWQGILRQFEHPLLAPLLMLLAWFSELYHFDTSSQGSIISLIATALVLVFWAASFFAVYYFSYNIYKHPEDNLMTNELFHSLRWYKYSMWYPVLFLTRRILLASIAICK